MAVRIGATFIETLMSTTVELFVASAFTLECARDEVFAFKLLRICTTLAPADRLQRAWWTNASVARLITTVLIDIGATV